MAEQTAVSAVGGYVLFYLTEADFLIDDPVTIEVDTWAGNWACDYTSFMPAANGPGMLKLVTSGDPTWQMTFPLDNDAPLEVLEIEQGMVIYSAFFRRGDQLNEFDDEVFDEVDFTTITGISMVNVNGKDAFRVMISGSGGNVYQGVT